jgi:hypothetical protein
VSNEDSTPQVPEPPRYGQRQPEGDVDFGSNASSNAPRYGQNAPQYPAGQQPDHQSGQNVPPNPYGQNPYGQNSYGQNPYGGQPSNNPYGQNAAGQQQQWGQSGYQQQGGFGAPGIPAKPKELKIASILLYIAAGLTLISGIALLMIPNQAMIDFINATPNAQQQFDQLEAQGISLDELISMSKTVGAIFTFIAAALYAVIGFFIGKGSNGARITGTVLAVLSLFVFTGAGIQGWLMLALGVAAIVLAWLRPSSDYIAARSAQRRMPRY